MSTLLPRNRVRILFDPSNHDWVRDVLTNLVPAIWQGADVQFEAGIGLPATPGAPAVIIAGANLTNIASITVEVRPANTTNASIAPLDTVVPVLSGTTDSIDDTVTAANWAAGIAWNSADGYQHGVIIFTKGQTNLAPGLYWLSAFATTDDDPAENIPLGAGKFYIKGSGSGTAPATPASAVATPALVQQLPNVTQIASNASTGLGDVPAGLFIGQPPLKIDCPDYEVGGAVKVTQFWSVANITTADSNGLIQSGPDYNAETFQYKWVRTL